ncbi:Uncharacterized small protein [Allochromatium warmingii]|uniref:Uncharacterized small protein n=1 Tax=Allochromatium warmingii TaxID=61595 RepID=A0A1H3J8I2_ALLWA|nr:DUF2158 domain-containing protein [Allochromatium warmingii]SDY35879.1 Uncharacterized small protein [Allochromatium warmingii]
MNEKQQNEFQIGDVVRLKSGGLKMTVVEYCDPKNHADKPAVKCKWFEQAERAMTELEKITYDYFPEAALVKVK